MGVKHGLSLKRKMQTEDVWEQSAEENIWTRETERNRKTEKIAQRGASQFVLLAIGDEMDRLCSTHKRW